MLSAFQRPTQKATLRSPDAAIAHFLQSAERCNSHTSRHFAFTNTRFSCLQASFHSVTFDSQTSY